MVKSFLFAKSEGKFQGINLFFGMAITSKNFEGCLADYKFYYLRAPKLKIWIGSSVG
jgi:hypothetical protein